MDGRSGTSASVVPVNGEIDMAGSTSESTSSPHISPSRNAVMSGNIASKSSLQRSISSSSSSTDSHRYSSSNDSDEEDPRFSGAANGEKNGEEASTGPLEISRRTSQPPKTPPFPSPAFDVPYRTSVAMQKQHAEAVSKRESGAEDANLSTERSSGSQTLRKSREDTSQSEAEGRNLSTQLNSRKALLRHHESTDKSASEKDDDDPDVRNKSIAHRRKKSIYKFKLHRKKNLREYLYMVLEDPGSSLEGKIIAFIVFLLIVGSTITLLVQSLPKYYRDDDRNTVCCDDGWEIAETIFVILFSFEVCLRFYACPNRWRFLLSPLAVIDVVAIMPFYVELALASNGNVDLRVVRVIRLVRIFRLFKVGRYVEGIRMTGRVLSQSADALLLGLGFLSLAIIVFSSAMYYAERGNWDGDLDVWIRCRRIYVWNATDHTLRPENQCEESPFQSIFHAFWWCVTTLTTVGYGDHVPISPGGKIVGALAMVIGILVIALPTSILGSNFLREYQGRVMGVTGPMSGGAPGSGTPVYSPHGLKLHRGFGSLRNVPELHRRGKLTGFRRRETYPPQEKGDDWRRERERERESEYDEEEERRTPVSEIDDTTTDVSRKDVELPPLASLPPPALKIEKSSPAGSPTHTGRSVPSENRTSRGEAGTSALSTPLASPVNTIHPTEERLSTNDEKLGKMAERMLGKSPPRKGTRYTNGPRTRVRLTHHRGRRKRMLLLDSATMMQELVQMLEAHLPDTDWIEAIQDNQGYECPLDEPLFYFQDNNGVADFRVILNSDIQIKKELKSVSTTDSDPVPPAVGVTASETDVSQKRRTRDLSIGVSSPIGIWPGRGSLFGTGSGEREMEIFPPSPLDPSPSGRSTDGINRTESRDSTISSLFRSEKGKQRNSEQ